VQVLPGNDLADVRSGAAEMRRLVPQTIRRLLVNLNLVSWDPTPFTTCPQLLEAVLELFPDTNVDFVAGPAIDKCTVYQHHARPLRSEVQESRTFTDRLRPHKHFEVFRRHYDAYVPSIRRYIEHLRTGTELGRRAAKSGWPLRLLGSADALDYRVIELDGIATPVFDLDPYDLIVNLPVVKRHTTVGFTAAIKNFYGLIEPSHRFFFHNRSAVGRVLTQLHESYLRGRAIVTLADARQVPGAQQSYWANPADTQPLCRLYVGLDCRALDQRIARDLFIGSVAPRDTAFCSWLQDNLREAGDLGATDTTFKRGRP
jgi:hypothetical protein